LYGLILDIQKLFRYNDFGKILAICRKEYIMKRFGKSIRTRLVSLFLCLAVLIPFGATLYAVAQTTTKSYVEPTFLVDFSEASTVDKFIYFNNTAATCKDKAAYVYFSDKDGAGYCGDPYFAFPLPTDSVELTTYHYFAMLIKTTYTEQDGELRFETTKTDGSFPCQRFSYKNTSDWQLIVIDLTDLSTLLFHNNRPIEGTLKHLRLDPFEDCASSVEYWIKAYALYDNLEDALTFDQFESKIEENLIPPLPDIDYSKYWMGEAFAHPVADDRMGWVGYGYNDLYKCEIDKLLAQGYGTVVSNVNFNPEYLRDDAEFDILRKTYDYAISKGMSTWIYDEYQWPSGKAFGLVLEGHDEFEANGIEHRVITVTSSDVEYAISGKDMEIMQAILTDESGTRNVAFSKNSLSVTATGEWQLDVYVRRKTYEGEEDRTDFTKLRDVNLLDPGAVKRFIDVTYVKYRDTFGDSFSNVKAFFTDEPQLGNRAKDGYAVWSEGFAEAFKARYGYDLNIASIFSGESNQDKLARVHYYQLVASLFKTSYVDQITDWCEANGTNSSGHFLFEEDMNDHIETYGGDFLQLVGGMTIPGLDLLWVDPDHLLSNNNIGNFMGLRYVKSAAKNANKSDVMVEWNPCTTDTEQFLNDKLGTSFGGAAISRLCGANIFHVIDPARSYTYPDINALNLYIARMNTILDGKREIGDVAVFYPIATVQAYHNADNDHSSTSGGAEPTKSYLINRHYVQLCQDLLQNQILYSVVDDQSLAAATVLEDGRIVVGEGVYRTLVIPYAEYMSLEACEKLSQFANGGGRVIFVETKPSHAMRADQDDEVCAIMDAIPSRVRNEMDASLIKDIIKNTNHLLSISRISNLSGTGLLYGDFADDTHEISFMVNTTEQDGSLTLSYKDGYTGTYTVYYPGSAMIEEYAGEATITVPRYEGVFVVRGKDEDITTPTDTETETDALTESASDTESTSSDTKTDTDAVPDGEKAGCKSALSVYVPAVVAGVVSTFIFRKKKKV
jgi:hypothetical protein